MQNLIYYIAGSDGSGKTTHLNKLINKSSNFKHVWIRSPKIFSKPLMFFCRIVGLTKYYIVDGIKYGSHDFYKSSFVSFVFPFLQLIDFKIKWIFCKLSIKPNQIIFFDRFCLDTLVDLMIDTRNMTLHETYVGKKFIEMLPQNCKVIILEVDEETIRNRKKDTLYDKNLSLKIEAYNILAKSLKLKKINNNRNMKLVEIDINNYFKKL